MILPVGPTQSNFQSLNPGYKITMSGTNVAATLLLTQELRLTSIVSQLPQPMRFTTEFANGPDGYLLKSVNTGDTSDITTSREAEFTFTYQTVDGFQIPSLVTAKPPGPEIWRFALTDCKVMRGIILKVGRPAL